MKFNLNKWQRLQNLKDDLYRKLHAISDDRDFTKRNFTRQHQSFIHRYDVTKDRSIEKRIIIDRKLTYSDILKRLELMKSNWGAVCGVFNLTQNTISRSSLIELYSSMVELKRLEELYEGTSTEIKNSMACWNTLEEFASEHIKISKLGYTPVA